MLVFILLLAWCATAVDLHTYSEILHFMERMGLWLNTIFVLLFAICLISFVTIYALNFLRKTLGLNHLVFPMTLIVMASVLIATKFSHSIISYVGIDIQFDQARYYREVGLNWLILSFFEVLVTLFVTGSLSKNTKRPIETPRQEAPPPRKTAKSRFLNLSNSNIPVDDVLYVAAQGRHVDIHFANGTLQTQLGYLSDIVSQVDERFGIFIHRMLLGEFCVNRRDCDRRGSPFLPFAL